MKKKKRKKRSENRWALRSRLATSRAWGEKKDENTRLRGPRWREVTRDGRGGWDKGAMIRDKKARNTSDAELREKWERWDMGF